MTVLAADLSASQPVSRGWPIAQLGGLAAMIAAITLLCMAPFVDRRDVAGNKYLPIFVSWCAWAVHLLTCRAALGQLLAILRVYWPLAVLGLTMTAGFFVAVNDDVRVTFRPHALAMLSFFPVCHLAIAADTTRFVRAALVLLGLGSLYMLTLAVVHFPRHIVHENLFLFTPMAVYFALASPRRWMRVVAALYMVFFAVIGLKNTTFIIAGVGIYGLYVFSQARVRDGSRSPVQWRSLLLLVLLSVLGWIALDYLKATVAQFSTGNTDFRTYLYEQKWAMFVGSPLWGDAFSGTPNVRFALFRVAYGHAQFLPSHSDLLDVLAHGGVLGAAAFLTGIGRIGLRSLRARPQEDRRLYAARGCLVVVCVSALVSCSFNPVLGNPANGFMFWSCFAMLAALDLRGLATDGTGVTESPSHA
jgi:hypothetical protein